MTLTKEWLLKTIAELEEERDATPGAVNEDAAKALAAMKLAMASLEAEPVCVIDQSNLDYLKSGSDADVWPASRAEMGDVLLYRSATPAPVSVPDAIHSQGEKSVGNDYYALGWNACRAAMLHGAEPVTTANKLPDDFDFDRFNDVTWLEAVASNPHMHSPTTSTIAMVALELNRRLAAGNSPVIPDGWVMVPEEPTHEMLEAGDEQFGTYDVYRRMI
ncbi:hypothetical protein V5028_19105, partial [Enterobacter hormaechei]|uniref:hypothetical protein n=1 Tax=Enterobacter hormaechei TaxID=158836 RepID=UPI003076878F